MALHIAQYLAASGRKCAKGDALVQLYIVSNLGGLAYYYASSVVDKEIPANGGSRMDVNTGQTMGIFRHHTGNQGHFQKMQFMSNPVYKNGI